MRDKPQLLHDRLPDTDPGMAAPQPVRLRDSCMASTTQGHSQHGRISSGLPAKKPAGSWHCSCTAPATSCPSYYSLSEELMLSQSWDASGIAWNTYWHVAAHRGCLSLDSPRSKSMAWVAWGGTRLPLCSHTKCCKALLPSRPSVGTGVFLPAHPQILWPTMLATSWCLSLPA